MLPGKIWGRSIMKKTILRVTIAFFALSLAGCGTTNDNAKSSSTTSVKTEQKKDKKSVSKRSAQKKSDKTSSSQSSLASSSVSSQSSSSSNGQQSEPSTNEPRLVSLNGDLNRSLGHVLLPEKDGLGQGSSKLNIRFSGDSANYVINYSVGSKARPLNDPALQNEVPYATFTKKTYGSFDDAKAAINYHSGSDDQGLPKVGLGHNISGVIDSGAGNRYLHWNEGQWSFVVHAAAVNGEDPTSMAKQVVELLESSYLPAPKSVGAGEFDVSGNNKLTWQDGQTVYSLTGKSARTLITMAASMQ